MLFFCKRDITRPGKQASLLLGLVRVGGALGIFAPVILSASFAAGVVLQLNAGQSFYCLSNLGVSQVPYVAYLFNIPLIVVGASVVTSRWL